jgi:F-type H+-transporting ATPase subunit a
MSALLLAFLLQAAPTHTAPPPPAAAEAVTPAQAEAHGATESHDEEADPAKLLAHHVLDQPVFGFPSKHLLYFVLASLLVVLIGRLALRSYRGGSVPRGIGAAVETLLVFVRDDIAEANIGHGDGRKYTPLLCSFFFFILVAALLGLVPLPGFTGRRWSLGSTTSTADITVTAALALVSFVAQQYAGISKYGVLGHFKNLIPPGMPPVLVPIMMPVELISMFTKPFALMIRLFANMLAGHIVVTTLILLIPLVAQIHWAGGVVMAPISIALALFIMLLEILVAFIQAYIFTLLTAIFIGQYAHPAH